jgi:DNA-binding XRE family transcriptional regulator
MTTIATPRLDGEEGHYSTKMVIFTNFLGIEPIYMAHVPWLAMVLIFMITARQIRAARALLGWTQKELADRAIVALNTIRLLERDAVDARSSTLRQVQRALEDGGVEFTPAEGVRLGRPLGPGRTSRLSTR